MSAHCISSWDWFTFCWVPVIPLGKKHKYVKSDTGLVADIGLTENSLPAPSAGSVKVFKIDRMYSLKKAAEVRCSILHSKEAEAPRDGVAGSPLTRIPGNRSTSDIIQKVLAFDGSTNIGGQVHRAGFISLESGQQATASM